MPANPTDELIEQNDLEGLLRRTEELCSQRDWAELDRLRARCRSASETGRQLWPAAVNAEYRLALEAPAKWAAPVAAASTNRFTIGPLTEVVASTHTWDELADHLPPGPTRALVAYERVLRGEELDDREFSDNIDTSIFDLPLRLESWEPTYPLASYESWRGLFPSPARPTLSEIDLPEEPAREQGDATATEALLELTRPWTSESNGRAEAVAVQGDVGDAIASLGVTRARLARIEPADALAVMAWTAASGGAHGRRRGMAAGRFNAWWTVAALADLTEDWPLSSQEIASAAHDMAWFLWDFDEPMVGWSLNLAISDAESGLSWAMASLDQRME